MQAKDLLTLVEYNHWANDRLLRRVNQLSSEDLETACWLSQGTVVNTLLHIADTQWYWRLACQEGAALKGFH